VLHGLLNIAGKPQTPTGKPVGELNLCARLVNGTNPLLQLLNLLWNYIQAYHFISPFGKA